MKVKGEKSRLLLIPEDGDGERKPSVLATRRTAKSSIWKTRALLTVEVGLVLDVERSMMKWQSYARNWLIVLQR